jgi:hypothetical protein
VAVARNGTDGTNGTNGTNGTPGAPGADGQTSYLHIKWSNDGGATFTAGSGETPGAYIGTYTDFTLADSSSVSAYTWALVKGADGTNGTNGTPGAPGADGQTSYLHIKWSNDGGATFTASSGETPGAYIGTYTDFTLADSTSVSAYTWALVKGADAAPTVRASLSVIQMSLAADLFGVVSSFAGASTTASISLNEVDDLSNWTITRSNGTGVTTSIAGNVVSLTALSVDSGYFDVIFTRAGYLTQTIRVSLSKVRSQTAAGMNPGFGVYGSDERTLPSGTARAGIRFKTNGVINSDALNDGITAAGDWYLPSTGGIGSAYSVKVVQTAGQNITGSAKNTWLAISGEPIFELGNGVAGTTVTASALVYIALTSNTGQVLATGTLDMEATKW